MNEKRTAAATQAAIDAKTWKQTPKCTGIRKDGERCGSFAGPDGYCRSHSPAIPDDVKKAERAKGGASTSKVARMVRLLPNEMRPVFEQLAGALTGVLDGTMSPQRASAAASVATAMTKVLHIGELEAKVRELEEVAGERAAGLYGSPTYELADGAEYDEAVGDA